MGYPSTPGPDHTTASVRSGAYLVLLFPRTEDVPFVAAHVAPVQTDVKLVRFHRRTPHGLGITRCCLLIACSGPIFLSALPVAAYARTPVKTRFECSGSFFFSLPTCSFCIPTPWVAYADSAPECKLSLYL